jgi:Uma2 family endonuclease
MIALESKLETYFDYLKKSEEGNFQLIGGQITSMTSPSTLHQRIVLKLTTIINEYLIKNKRGEVFVAPLDVYFSETEVYQPDIFVLLNSSFSKLKENLIEGAPDLIIEILSPPTAYYDLKHKKNIYEKFAVLEYWVVDPIAKTIEIFKNENNKYSLITELKQTGIAKSVLLQNLEIDLALVF